MEVTKSPEAKKTSKQKNKNNSQINKKAISEASAEIDVLNIELKDDPWNHACLTPENGTSCTQGRGKYLIYSTVCNCN